jgi:hypothetical protein
MLYLSSRSLTRSLSTALAFVSLSRSLTCASNRIRISASQGREAKLVGPDSPLCPRSSLFHCKCNASPTPLPPTPEPPIYLSPPYQLPTTNYQLPTTNYHLPPTTPQRLFLLLLHYALNRPLLYTLLHVW